MGSPPDHLTCHPARHPGSPAYIERVSRPPVPSRPLALPCIVSHPLRQKSCSAPVTIQPSTAQYSPVQHSTQHTAHSTQHTAHSAQHTAHNTQHAAYSICRSSPPLLHIPQIRAQRTLPLPLYIFRHTLSFCGSEFQRCIQVRIAYTTSSPCAALPLTIRISTTFHLGGRWPALSEPQNCQTFRNCPNP
ncbi:hypothetical protein K431DRAFT_155066 [Polychaeton citri CBS 116435]|uniref:Uncharacterized protein n=1 Tax=Polychaeton citri CBS 116435 TaxID=1314669 RepID=A0A9P4QG65_9PEZI|nr:hypothetical protein K431DRAFT_155066 [Polychaeton citri CBS 116435]